MVPMPAAMMPTIRTLLPGRAEILVWIAASTMAPIAPMAPASVGVARPSIMVPSTTKISTAEGMMPSRHFFHSGQPVSVSAVLRHRRHVVRLDDAEDEGVAGEQA